MAVNKKPTSSHLKTMSDRITDHVKRLDRVKRLVEDYEDAIREADSLDRWNVSTDIIAKATDRIDDRLSVLLDSLKEFIGDPSV